MSHELKVSTCVFVTSHGIFCEMLVIQISQPVICHSVVWALADAMPRVTRAGQGSREVK